MPDLDLELVRHALKVARNNGFTEVGLKVADAEFTAKLRPMAPTAKPPEQPTPEETKPHAVTSTFVGYYREAKQPLRVGQVVEKGDLVAVVAALGIANDVESKVSGEVIEVLVEPNQPVEYGQPLARVRPL